MRSDCKYVLQIFVDNVDEKHTCEGLFFFSPKARKWFENVARTIFIMINRNVSERDGTEE